jgi:Fic family protein
MSAGQDVPIVWRGRRVMAFLPTLLTERDLTLSMQTIRRTATAEAAAAAAAATMPADYDALARLLLRAEGVASSFIEGLAAPLVDVVLAETVPSAKTPAAWIAANRAAVSQAIDRAHGAPLDIAAICDWHRTLMAGSPLPSRYVGAIRDEQGWIGGTSPLDAALVTPPPERLVSLLDDLINFANRSDLDPIAQAAVAQAQFEVIHPFADGNGRVGRLLISWLLTRRLALITPPPVSIRLAADRGGYLAGLTLFRLGQHDPWVRWFADVVVGAGETQRALIAAVDSLRLRWQHQLGDMSTSRRVRRDALAWRVLDLLPRFPVLTAQVAARELGTSTRAALNALDTLVDAEIVVNHVAAGARPVGRPGRVFTSPALLGLLGSNPLG